MLSTRQSQMTDRDRWAVTTSHNYSPVLTLSGMNRALGHWFAISAATYTVIYKFFDTDHTPIATVFQVDSLPVCR